MSELVVAGGTGQEVALAVARLSYLSGVECPRIWVFDSDVAARETGSEGRSRAQALQDLQQQLRACGVWEDQRLEFLNPTVLSQRMERVEHIRDVFAQHGRLEEEDHELLQLLLTEEQLGTSINDGFHGQPALGSLALAAAFEQGAFNPFLDQLRQRASAQGGLRVVLAGSIAGGTGTSVVPLVAKEIRRLVAQGIGRRVEILGVFQLPWFELKPVASDPLSSAPDVDTAMFDRNASCLLRGYLEQTFQREIDSAVIVGLPKQVTRASHGGSRQPETHHYVCLVAGITAVNLLSPQATEAALGPDWRGFHAPSLGTPGSTALDGPPNGPAVFVGGKQLSVAQLLKQALDLLALSQALLKETENLTPNVGHQRAVYEALDGLRSPQAREEFRGSLETIDRLHAEIVDWLKRSLLSEVGKQRADHWDAFMPPEGWSRIFADGPGDFLRRRGSWLPWPAFGRRVVTRSGPLPSPASEGRGRRAAWALVSQGRRNFLEST